MSISMAGKRCIACGGRTLLRTLTLTILPDGGEERGEAVSECFVCGGTGIQPSVYETDVRALFSDGWEGDLYNQ